MPTKRHEVVPEDFVKHLQKKIPGFKAEADAHQWELAHMLWVGGSKHREHLHFAGAMSFSQKELEGRFGRGQFKAINARLEFFSVSDQWFSDQAMTKGYWLTEAVKAARGDYLKKRWTQNTRLLMANGQFWAKIPKAVASKDMRGITTTAWRSASALNKVRVNQDALKQLRQWLLAAQADYMSGRVPADLFTPYPNEQAIQRLIDIVGQILRLSKVDVVGNGYISHMYVQSESGRLYAKGINLQTTPTLIKQAALSGLWEYDFSNCHYSILGQMAERHGYSCQAVAHYLSSKKLVRDSLSQEVGISTEQAKTCLLAILYGARASEWHGGAIVDAIGVDKARLLYKVDVFSDLQQDIKQARKAILASWPRTANGRLTNAFGRAIAGSAKPEEKLAHLIQGVEAKALQAAINLYPDDICLLQHDGFASSRRLDAKAIEQAVETATGYVLRLEEAIIKMDPDKQFQKNRIQNVKGTLPNADGGSGHPRVS